jgi:hypothetical protein
MTTSAGRNACAVSRTVHLFQRQEVDDELRGARCQRTAPGDGGRALSHSDRIRARIKGNPARPARKVWVKQNEMGIEFIA